MDIQGQEQQSAINQGGDAGAVGRAPLLGPNTVKSWLILAGSLGMALAIYYGFIGSSFVDVVAAWTASWTSEGLNLLGTSTTVRGTILSSDSFAGQHRCRMHGGRPPGAVHRGRYCLSRAFEGQDRWSFDRAGSPDCGQPAEDYEPVLDRVGLPRVSRRRPLVGMADSHHSAGDRAMALLGREVRGCSEPVGC